MAHVATPRQPLRSQSSNPVVFRPLATNRASSTRPAQRDTVKQPLYRRLLFPKEPPDKAIRQIIVGQGLEVEQLNERLYMFLAYAMRAYVQSWYTRISPQDKTFIPLVASTIVNFIKPLAANVTSDRLLPFLLLHVPTIVTRHIQLYRIAAAHQGTSLAPLEMSQRDLGHAYHSLAPLLACSSVQKAYAASSEKSTPVAASPASSASSTSPPMETENTPSYQISPVYLQQLVTSIMKLHLPAEDFAPDAERIVVREIVANVILGNVLHRVSHAWFWWKVGLAVLGEPGITPSPAMPVKGLGVRAGNGLLQVLLLGWGSLLRIMSMAWKSLDKAMQSRSNSALDNQGAKIRSQYKHVARPALGLARVLLPPQLPYTARTTFAIAEAVETLANSKLDTEIPRAARQKLFTPAIGLKVIEKLTDIVFPLEGGYPAPTLPDPTPAEAAAMRDKLEIRIHQLMPPAVRFLMLSPHPEEQHRKISEMLDPFSDTACNAHLVAMLLESLMLTLVPELEVGSAS